MSETPRMRTLHTVVRGEIHGATVTSTDLDVAGGISLDLELLSAADIEEFEQVEVTCLDTGARLETYALAAGRGTGMVCLNGPAARLLRAGDRIALASRCLLEPRELAEHRSLAVYLDNCNRPVALLPRSLSPSRYHLGETAPAARQRSRIELGHDPPRLLGPASDR